MKQLYRLLLLVLLILPATIFSQEAKPYVIASGGGSSQSIAGYSIDFTAGETIILTAGTNPIFTQGFHQPLSAKDYPVVQMNLRGTPKDGYILLEWTTTSETNNAWFYIERSTDGIVFTTVDSVRTKALNGNSASPLNYDRPDLQPVNGTNHYRLRQVSQSGQIRYSETIQVNFAGATWRVRIYPNPVHGTLFLQLYSDQQTKLGITLHTLNGQLVSRLEVNMPTGYSKQSLEMGHMKAGVYILSVRDTRTDRKLHVKVVKN